MSIAGFLKRETKELLTTTLFFLSGFLLILGLFKLMLEDYDIPFDAFAKALFGALVLGKVVLILRNRAFLQVFPDQAGIVRVLYKTSVYLAGVFVIVSLEKVIEAYGEAGGFLPALRHVAETRTIHKAAATALLVGVQLAAFNCWDELKSAVGRDKLVDTFFRKRAAREPR